MLAEGPAASFAIVPYARQRLGPDYERFPRLIFAEYSQTNPMHSPSDLQTTASTRMLEEAIEIISHVDPVIHGEIKALLRRIYLATANKAPSAKRFGGVTSFLVWGRPLSISIFTERVGTRFNFSSTRLLMAFCSVSALTSRWFRTRPTKATAHRFAPTTARWMACFTRPSFAVD